MHGGEGREGAMHGGGGKGPCRGGEGGRGSAAAVQAGRKDSLTMLGTAEGGGGTATCGGQMASAHGRLTPGSPKVRAQHSARRQRAKLRHSTPVTRQVLQLQARPRGASRLTPLPLASAASMAPAGPAKTRKPRGSSAPAATCTKPEGRGPSGRMQVATGAEFGPNSLTYHCRSGECPGSCSEPAASTVGARASEPGLG